MPKIEKIKIASIEDLHRSLDEKMSEGPKTPENAFSDTMGAKNRFRAYLANFENGEILVFKGSYYVSMLFLLFILMYLLYLIYMPFSTAHINTLM